MSRPDTQPSRESRAALLASCIAFSCYLCLTAVITSSQAQDITTPPTAEPEAHSLPSALPDATFFTRTFRADPSSLVQLISVPGAQLANPQQAFRFFLTSHGVELSDTSRFFYNDRTGLITARATLQELDAIQTALAALSITPPQVMLRTLLAELSADALPADLKKFLLLPDPQVSLSGTNLTVRPGFLVLTESQTRVVIRALEQRPGVDMLSAPTITTLSGRRARLSLEQVDSPPIFDPPLSAPGKTPKFEWSTKPTIAE